jgi:hypothetical protein
MNRYSKKKQTKELYPKVVQSINFIMVNFIKEDGSATTAADPSSVWAQGVKWLQSKLG